MKKALEDSITVYRDPKASPELKKVNMAMAAAFRAELDRVGPGGKRGETERGNIFQRFTVDDIFQFHEPAFDTTGQQDDFLPVRQRQFEGFFSGYDLSGGAAVFVPQESQRFIHFFCHFTDS